MELLSFCGLRHRRVLGAVTVMVASATLAAACGSSSGSTGSSSGKAPITIALLAEASGAMGAQFATNVPGVEAWVSYENAQGGIYGHHIDLKVYNNASNPTTAVSNAHLAVEQGAVAILAADPFFDSYASYLVSQKEPVFGFGFTPGFYASDAKMFFSFLNSLLVPTDSMTKFFLSKGRDKWAFVSDNNTSDSGDLQAQASGIAKGGGKLVYTNYSVDPTNAASLLAVAEAIKKSGAQVAEVAMLTNVPQVQVDLSQVGASNIWVLSASEYATTIPQQFGPGVDGYVYQAFIAPTFSSTPGVLAYQAAMHKYQPSTDYHLFNGLIGWNMASLLGAAIQALHGAAVTKASLTTAGNTIKNYTGEGLVPPLSYPTARTTGVSCSSFSQVMGGKWTILSGNPSAPFFCS